MLVCDGGPDGIGPAGSSIQWLRWRSAAASASAAAAGGSAGARGLWYTKSSAMLHRAPGARRVGLDEAQVASRLGRMRTMTRPLSSTLG